MPIFAQGSTLDRRPRKDGGTYRHLPWKSSLRPRDLPRERNAVRRPISALRSRSALSSESSPAIRRVATRRSYCSTSMNASSPTCCFAWAPRLSETPMDRPVLSTLCGKGAARGSLTAYQPPCRKTPAVLPVMPPATGRDEGCVAGAENMCAFSLSRHSPMRVRINSRSGLASLPRMVSVRRALQSCPPKHPLATENLTPQRRPP